MPSSPRRITVDLALRSACSAMIPLLFLLLAIGVWWWMSNQPITVPRVEEVTARIAFPRPLRLDEIVIPHQYANLVLTFPLSKPATLAIESPIPYGFTRAELVRAICHEYDTIYDIEEATANTKPLPPELRDRVGRNRTDGLYGIWGHDLSELVCTAIHWTRSSDSRVTIRPHVEVLEKPKLDDEAQAGGDKPTP